MQILLEAYTAIFFYWKVYSETVWWDVALCTEVSDWELEELLDLFEKLYPMRDMGRGEDFLRWIPAANASFQVKIDYQVLAREANTTFS